MRNRLFVHPYQLDNSTYFSVFTIQGKTFYRHLDFCPQRAEANRLMLELRQNPGSSDDWQRLDLATFTGCLTWTPYILLTDLAKPYSLRVGSERTRSYRLTCQVDACIFLHPTCFTTELETIQARRDVQRDLSKLTDWDLMAEAGRADSTPTFTIQRDDAVTYRIEMVAPSAIYRHPDAFQTFGDAKLAIDRILAQYGNAKGTIMDPSRLIQALDGDSESWEYDPQARKKSRSFSFFNLALDHRTWVQGFALWNRDRFRGTHMLREDAQIRVTATPSFYREKIQWRVRDFQLVRPAMHDRVVA